LRLKNLKLKGFDEFVAIFITVCFFLLFFTGRRGILMDFAFAGLLLSGIYSIVNIEIFLVFVIFAGAIKSTYFNVLPPFLDLTLVSYFFLICGLLLHVFFNRKKMLRFYMFDLIFFFMLISVTISLLNSPSRVFKYGLEKYFRFVFLAVPFFFIPRFFKESDYKNMSLLFAIFGAVFSLAIFLYYPDFVVMIHSGVNYLPVAKMAGISFIFNLFFFVNKRGFVKKTLFLTLSMFSLLMVLKANSRGGILYLFMVVSLYLYFVLKEKKFYVLLILSAILSGIFIVLTVSPDSFRRLLLLFGRHKGFSVSERLIMYRLSLRLISKFWFTGIGLGGFAAYHYLKYPHNIFLEFFVETGIAGFLSISMFFCYLGYTALKLIERFRFEGYHTPYILSFVFVSMYHLTSFSMVDLRWLFFFAGCVFVFFMETFVNKKEGEKENYLKI